MGVETPVVAECQTRATKICAPTFLEGFKWLRARAIPIYEFDRLLPYFGLGIEQKQARQHLNSRAEGSGVLRILESVKLDGQELNQPTRERS